MPIIQKNLKFLIFLIFLSVTSPDHYVVLAQKGRGTGERPTAYLDLGAGITTYKSLAVKSNDTSFTIGYKLGVFAGRNRSIGFFINNESNTTNFTYADSEQTSKIITSFQDTAILYRWGVLQLGPVFSQQQITMTKQDEEYLDNLGSGIGGHAGLLFQVGRDTKLFLEVTQATISVLKESIQDVTSAPVAGGSRTDIDLGGIIQLTRSVFDMRIGYKQRTFTISVSGESFEETQTFTWIGFGMKGYF